MKSFTPLTIIVASILSWSADARRPFMNSFGGAYCALANIGSIEGKRTQSTWCVYGTHWVIGSQKGWLRTAPAGGRCVDIEITDGHSYLFDEPCKRNKNYPSWEWADETGVKLKSGQNYSGEYPLLCGISWTLATLDEVKDQKISCKKIFG